MKYNVNITYTIEVPDEERAKQVVDVLAQNTTLTDAIVTMTGFSCHRAYEPPNPVQPD